MVPFSRALVGAGSVFTCRRCDAKLITPKVGFLNILIFFPVVSLFGNRILEQAFGIFILIALFMAFVLLEYLFLPVRLHETSDEAEKDVSEGDFRA